MVKIYSTSWCPSCVTAKRLLENENIEFEEINIEEQGMGREDLKNITGGMTVPQIMINEKSIGGFDSLVELNQSGKLKKMLSIWNLLMKRLLNIAISIHIQILPS